MSVFIIYLDGSHFGELLEIEVDEICNIEIPAFRCTYAFEVNMCNAVTYFQVIVTCETVIDTNPAVLIFFCCARTFEKFIERSFE